MCLLIQSKARFSLILLTLTLFLLYTQDSKTPNSLLYSNFSPPVLNKAYLPFYVLSYCTNTLSVPIFSNFLETPSFFLFFHFQLLSEYLFHLVYFLHQISSFVILFFQHSQILYSLLPSKYVWLKRELCLLGVFRPSPRLAVSPTPDLGWLGLGLPPFS